MALTLPAHDATRRMSRANRPVMSKRSGTACRKWPCAR